MLRVSIKDTLTMTVILAGRTVLVNTSFVDADNLGCGFVGDKVRVDMNGQYGFTKGGHDKVVRNIDCSADTKNLTLYVVNSPDFVQANFPTPAAAAEVWRELTTLPNV